MALLNRVHFACAITTILTLSAAAQDKFLLKSPCEKVTLHIDIRNYIYFSASFQNIQMLSQPILALITDRGAMGIRPRVQTSRNRNVRPPIPNASGKLGGFVAVARRKGDAWSVGTLNDWAPRDLVINLNFPGAKPYRAQICSDGINADKAAVDYTLYRETLNSGQNLRIHMAAGGGYVAKLIPANQ